MPELTVMHVSDLHFSGPASKLSPASALNRAITAARPYLAASNNLLFVTGDVTDRGNAVGFTEAKEALRDAQDSFAPNDIVMCPGNHDIVNDSIGPFNRFCFDVTRDPQQNWSSQAPVAVLERYGYRILAINSYFELDPASGRIPLDSLRASLDSWQGEPCIVLLHDSPISSRYGAQGLVEGYDFLDVVWRSKVSAVFHGHVHTEQILPVGTLPTMVSGVGSLSYPPERNMNNHFSLYRFTSGELSEAFDFKYYENREAFSARPVDL